MRFAFWRSNKKGQIDTLSWNLMVSATDPDACWELASLFRKTSLPNNALTCETSFLMGSIVRDVIRSRVPEADRERALISAEAAYFKTFDDQSDEALPPEMEDVYGKLRLGHIARIALAAYGEQNDILPLTSASFVGRIKGDPRMKFEVFELFEERKTILGGAYGKILNECAQ